MRLNAVPEDLVTAEFDSLIVSMKRAFWAFPMIAAALSALLSCGVSRNAVIDKAAEQADSRAHDYFFMEGVKQYNAGHYDAALDLMTHSLDYDTASAATCFSMAQYYMSLNDRELLNRYAGTAQKLLLKAVSLEPDNYWYGRLLAMNYLRQNRTKDAIAVYEGMSVRFPGRTDILITLAELYDDAGDYEKELRVLTRYGQIEDVADQLKFQRFVCYLQLGELDSAYYEAENPAHIIELLMNTTRDMIEHAESQMDRINCRSLLDVVMEFCNVVAEHEPELATAYSQRSIAWFWLGENEKALGELSRGLANVRDPKDKAAIYTLRGDFHHTLGQKELMFADYDSTLMYEPDNIEVLNNYAYFLSLEDRDLKRALEMSGRTLEAEPFSSTYLDTYAWILFRMKRYTEALNYLEKALRYLESDNSDIYEHYGDALYMCGEKDKALDNWHKAFQLNSSSATLNQKIRQEKYVE